MAAMEITHEEEKNSLLEAEKKTLKAGLKSLLFELVSLPQEKPTPKMLSKLVGKLGFDSIHYESYLSPNDKWIVIANTKEAGDISLFKASNLAFQGKLTFGDLADSPVVQTYQNAVHRNFFISPDSQYFVSSSQKADLMWNMSKVGSAPTVLEKPKGLSHCFLEAVSSDKW